MTPMALLCFDTEIVNLNAAQYIRLLSILPWSEARKTSGRPFFAMRNIETLAILYEARESIMPYAEGKVNLATARLNFQKSILDLLGKVPDHWSLTFCTVAVRASICFCCCANFA